MIYYPSDKLPNPSQSYSGDINNNAIRTEMDSGRIRQRRRFVDSQNQISVTWRFTDEEFQYFESFAFHALNGGTSWFKMSILTGGGIKEHTVRIVGGKYRFQYVSYMCWDVSAVLDIEQINRMDENDLFIDMFGQDMGVFAKNIDNIMDKYYTRSWYE